jgi:hypothetical protein
MKSYDERNNYSENVSGWDEEPDGRYSDARSIGGRFRTSTVDSSSRPRQNSSVLI